MIDSYNKNYKYLAGNASINIQEAVAGEKINCLLTYKAGKLGIDDSGSLKILYRLASDAGEPQFRDATKDNFVKIFSSNKKIIFSIDSKSEGTKGKIGVRPWSRGFCLNISGDELKDGDKIYFQLKNWRMQTFCENNFQLKILADPFATGRYIELPNSPAIKIISGKPQKLTIISPSSAKKNQYFHSLIKLEDIWGNPCYDLNGEFEIINHKEFSCAKKIKFKNGKTAIKIKAHSEIVFLKARYQTLTGISNPTVIKTTKSAQNHYWSELHAQSEETVGTNDIDSYFSFAKNYAAVDVICHQGNDFQITDDFWKKINKITVKYNRNNRFVALPGYEWSGNTSKGGDRNVIYFNENQPIYHSSRALIENRDIKKDDARDVNVLFNKIKNKKAILMAHVGGRYADLNKHDAKTEKLIEVHSCWGTFEWFLFEALKKNYKVGFAANSDGHDGRPGASYPGASHFVNRGGLTCILANELNRSKIFEALKKRHCYATTGARIFLDVSLKNGKNKLGIMGDAISIKGAVIPDLSIASIGTSPIERIEIYNKDRLIEMFFSEIKTTDIKYIKIVWKGAGSYGRSRQKSWFGKVKLLKLKIAGQIETVNFYNRKSSLKLTGDTIALQGETAGNNQALILPIYQNANREAAIQADINGAKIIIPIDAINKAPKRYKTEGLDSYIEIYETVGAACPTYMKLEKKLTGLNKGLNSIFVKIIQRDGNLAWSSPIFIKK